MLGLGELLRELQRNLLLALQVLRWVLAGFPDLNCVGCTWLQLTDSRGASTLRWYHSQSGSHWVPAQEEGFSESLHSGAGKLLQVKTHDLRYRFDTKEGQLSQHSS